jgi:hypothetical protein
MHEAEAMRILDGRITPEGLITATDICTITRQRCCKHENQIFVHRTPISMLELGAVMWWIGKEIGLRAFPEPIPIPTLRACRHYSYAQARWLLLNT